MTMRKLTTTSTGSNTRVQASGFFKEINFKAGSTARHRLYCGVMAFIERGVKAGTYWANEDEGHVLLHAISKYGPYDQVPCLCKQHYVRIASPRGRRDQDLMAQRYHSAICAPPSFHNYIREHCQASARARRRLRRGRLKRSSRFIALLGTTIQRW